MSQANSFIGRNFAAFSVLLFTACKQNDHGGDAAAGGAENLPAASSSVPTAVTAPATTPTSGTSALPPATLATLSSPSSLPSLNTDSTGTADGAGGSTDVAPPDTTPTSTVAGESGGAPGAIDAGANEPAATNSSDAGGAAVSEPMAAPFEWVPVEDLPVIEEMPDPLTLNDGTKVTTPEQWRVRRQEMMAILEAYEYGHMPPAPGNVTAEVVSETTRIDLDGDLQADYRLLHLSFGPEQSLGFDLGLFTPATDLEEGATGYPVLISLAFNAGENSLGGATSALERGYAVATIPFQQLGADSPDYASTAFFPAYPDYDWRDFSAWAWGISRSVDYLVTDPLIDGGKIIITGTSRLGQAVLLAGAFDERIALTAPVAGGMALRFSGAAEMGDGLGQGIKEVVDQNTYWFGPHFEEFRDKTEQLPSDQHWLLALTAPRLFIMCNSFADQYGRAYAAVQTYVAAKPVYDFLGASDNLGLHFREGGHGATAEDWGAILDFADQYLLQKGGTTRFDVIPPADKTP